MALHAPRVDHDPYPGCCGAWGHDLLEATDWLDGLGELGWHLAADVSLPTSVPRGEPKSAPGRIEDLRSRHAKVLWVLRMNGPLTDEEIAERIHSQTPQSIRSRRAELVRAGHVVKTSQRRPTKNGGTAAVWAARHQEVEVAA